MNVIESLKDATRDLYFISETDAPFEVIMLEGKEHFGPSDAVKAVGKSPETCVNEVLMENFFKNLTEIKSWHGDPEKRDAKRFQDLQTFILKELSNCFVFSVGETEKDILIGGRAHDGRWVGLKTKSVET